jgi:hypothetical protein
MLTNLPYTMIAIMPTNKALMSADAHPESSCRRMVQQWGRLHAGRSALGVLAIVGFLWPLNT